MITKAQARAITKYDAKTYDRINIRVRKDSILSRESIHAHADAVGESLNEYITKAILQRFEREDPA